MVKFGLMVMQDLSFENWLTKNSSKFAASERELIKKAFLWLQVAIENNQELQGQSYLKRGVMMAEILHQLNTDCPTIIAAILGSGGVQVSSWTNEDIADHFGGEISKLISSVWQMNSISDLYQGLTGVNYQQNIDNIRKMFFVMVDDLRVVLIKIAEQLCILRGALILPEKLKIQLAQETLALYAPLANRLGIAQIKWELEDLSFCYLEPEKYKKIAADLGKQFPKSGQYLHNVIELLQTLLANTQIKPIKISGRTKHVYSIYRKMERKKIEFTGVYDVSAVRIFTPTIADCYAVLGYVHANWQYLPEEFDDYIAAPKANGYRSIHTAIYGPDQRIVEIQIRTYEMHQEAELGIAAHWVYKEGKQNISYEAKLAWLRQVMAWQQEISHEVTSINLGQIFSDYIYVFTQQGDVLELPKQATVLDFAYYVHSELGHRCCGAKVNQKIVPLTYVLKTGDRVEILTAKGGVPSRDWLVTSLGFLHTSRARTKVLSWFRRQSQEYHLAQGQALLNQELRRLNLNKIDLEAIAKQLHFKDPASLLVALGGGDLKLGTLLNLVPEIRGRSSNEAGAETIWPKLGRANYSSDIEVQGVGNLLVVTASCCKPLPGEKIIGYITQGRGISIHRVDCLNAKHLKQVSAERFIEVAWGKKTDKKYPVDIIVGALTRPDLVRDITNLLATEKIRIISLELITNKKEEQVKIKIGIEISRIEPLTEILDKIKQLSNVVEVCRNN